MNYKKLTALTIALNCVTAMVPATLNIGQTAAYAASEKGSLKDISVETSKGSDITIYTKSSCSSKYKLSKLKDDDKVPTTLYAKVESNVSKVKFQSIDLKDGSDYTYKIYKGSTEIDLDKNVQISSSSSFKIKILDGTDVVETYTLKISKESDNDTDDEDDDNYDDIYLDKLELTTFDNKDIKLDFKKSTSSYDINVDNNVTSVKICAEPEYSDYTVRINGTKAYEDDDWIKKVSLSEGKNEIPVKIKDDDNNERTYTLNITRKAKTDSSSTSNTTNNTTNTVNPSPSTTAPTFPTAKLGWVSQGGNWYFVQPDGKCVTGWVYSNYKWYYMDTTGVMKTGWVQVPSNNKWYYFYSNGDMASNTIIGGYRLGSDGAWIQ